MEQKTHGGCLRLGAKATLPYSREIQRPVHRLISGRSYRCLKRAVLRRCSLVTFAADTLPHSRLAIQTLFQANPEGR